MNILGIIPARYGSTRFPGKPLALIAGKPMVQWVWERSSESRLVRPFIIATDDERILTAAFSFNAQAVITRSSHRCGMERAAEVASRYLPDAVVIVQGDEPLVRADMIDLLASQFKDPSVEVASLMVKPTARRLSDPNAVKVCVNRHDFALSFVRRPDVGPAAMIHLGLYAYRTEALLRIASTNPPEAELKEGLEQFRALCSGYQIKMVETSGPLHAVDCPTDLPEVERLLAPSISA